MDQSRAGRPVFKYLYPKEFADLSDKLQTYFANRQQYIDEVAQVLRDELQANEIPAVVTGRPKHLVDLSKTVKTGRDLDQLFDIIAFRAIVKNVRDCYAALGVVRQVDSDSGPVQRLHRAAWAEHVPVAAHVAD